MAKQPAFDLMKWWPLLTALVILIGHGFLAEYRIEQLEQKMTRQWEGFSKLNQYISDLGVKIARLEGTRGL